MSDLPLRIAADLQHRAIEAAKRAFKAETCVQSFDECLADAAAKIVHARDGMHWHVGERNGGWTLDVWWDPDDDDRHDF